MRMNHVTAGLVAAVAGALVLAVPAPAAAVQATQSTVVNAIPATYTPDVNNGIVYAIGQSGSTVVIGGSFTSVSPHGSSTTFADNELAAFTAGTGALVTGFAPTVNGTVTTIVAGPTSGTVFVGGDFSTIDGMNSKVALISTATGAIVPGWASPSINGEINSIVFSGGQLFVGGYFTTVAGSSRVGLAVLNATTGALSSYATPTFTGHHNYGRLCNPSTSSCASAGTGIKALDINPAGTRLIAIGNFVTVSGAARDQVALLDLGSSAATVDTSWATAAYSAECAGGAFDTYVRDVQFSPDGSYFVVAATGGGAGSKNSDGTQNSCDAAARYETSGSGADVRPTWIDYTGNDTFLSLAVTGTAVYVGGHQRWVNNSTGSDSPKEGAVPRPGIVALDPINGMPLSWNPGRNPRGAGAYALLATSDGLYVGSDTDYIGNFKYLHKELAFFPLAGGETLASNATGSLPGTVYLLGSGTSASTARSVQWNGSAAPGTPSTLTAVDWSTARGAFEVNNEVYYGDTDGNFYQRSFDGTTFGPAVAIDPYDDPAWDTVQTGSGQTYQGLKSSFYGEIPSLTSMFYSAGRVYYTLSGSSDMFWRWFEPDSGVMGADEFTTTDRLDWSHVAGAFLSGSTLYYADSASRALYQVPFTGGQAAGVPTLSDASINWASLGAFVTSSNTTTSLAVAPASPLSQYQNMTLTATVSLVADATIHPAGTVTFTDGSITLGSATVDTTTGDAALTTSSAPPSAPNGAVLTASFSPADGTPRTSTSSPVTYTVDPVAAVPGISGAVQVGTRVTCVEPTLSGETAGYVWNVNATMVATGQSYRVPAAADKKSLACTATVSMGSGPTNAATSQAQTVARGAALSDTKRPMLSGSPTVGGTESVRHGTWSPAASSYSYQWYRAGYRIRHATKSSLTLIKSERGATITCRVTAHKTGYASGSATTKPVTVRKPK